jgi:hypothetical protein
MDETDMSVHGLPQRRASDAQAGGLASGGKPPYDPTMETRVAKLEECLGAIKVDIAVVRASHASKEDLHREISGQTWKLVSFVCGFGTALVGATYFIATHVR